MQQIMQTGAAKSAVDVRALIIDTLNLRAYRPAELLEKLQSTGVNEVRLKDELALLIEVHIVEISPERHIRLRPTVRP